MKTKSKSTLTPKLRFQEFVDAGAWQKVPVGKVLAVRDEKRAASKNVPLYSLTIENGVTEKTARYNREFLVTNSKKKYKIVKYDDLVYNPSNLRWGAINFSRISHDVVVSPIYEVLYISQPDENNAGYVQYALMRPEQIQMFIRMGQGTLIERIAVKIEDFIATSMPLPTAAEQQKIADCLSSLDGLIAAEGWKLEALRDHKRGLMQQLFPQPGETQPRLRFPEFRDKGEWGESSLGNLLSRKPEYGVNAAAVLFSEDLPTYIRITDIDDEGQFAQDNRVSVDIESTEENYLVEGDIVLARTGASVGKSYRYRQKDGRLVFAGFLIRVRPNLKKLVPDFLSNYLTTWQYWDWVRVNSARSGQPGINGSEYASMPVPLPPAGPKGIELAEQQKIAACLTALDTRIAAQAAKIESLKQHKRGLMQQLFPSPEEQ